MSQISFFSSDSLIFECYDKKIEHKYLFRFLVKTLYVYMYVDNNFWEIFFFHDYLITSTDNILPLPTVTISTLNQIETDAWAVLWIMTLHRLTRAQSWRIKQREISIWKQGYDHFLIKQNILPASCVHPLRRSPGSKPQCYAFLSDQTILLCPLS